jgi:molybdopterin molybdotransferase
MGKASEFFEVAGTADVLRLFEGIEPLGRETVPLTEGLGRVLAADASATADIPHFNRSVMDGYAVRAADTFGCSESQPSYLTCDGTVEMGRPPEKAVRPGKTQRISTGGMLPGGSDAVVMWEYTREENDLVEVFRPVAPGENVARAGEDLRRGEAVLKAGRRLRPPDVGLLSALGYPEVEVRSRPRVAVVSTGDELVGPGDAPGPAQIRNVNQYSLGAWIERIGAEPLLLGLVQDDLSAISARVGEGLERADVVLISGGSSAGTRDLTRKVIEGVGDPGLLCHGLAVRPGKPTVVGARGSQPVFGLPGHPVSAMVIFLVLVRPVLNMLQGLDGEAGVLLVPARLGDNLPSQAGREDYYQVRLERRLEGLTAWPIFKKSGLVTAMVQGDGMVRVPSDREGLETGEGVDVEVFSL